MARQIPINNKIPDSKLDNPAVIKDLMTTIITIDETHAASFPFFSHSERVESSPQISYKKTTTSTATKEVVIMTWYQALPMNRITNISTHFHASFVIILSSMTMFSRSASSPFR